jgi:hypothetical protein
MKKVSTLLMALALLTPLTAASAAQAPKPVSSAASAKPAKAPPPPSPVYLCANKARANKLVGVEHKLFMSDCLQSKNPAQFK